MHDVRIIFNCFDRGNLQPQFSNVVFTKRRSTRLRPVQRLGRDRDPNPDVRDRTDDALLAILVGPVPEIRHKEPDGRPLHGGPLGPERSKNDGSPSSYDH